MGYLILLFIAITCGVIGAVIAKEKGRNVGGWFALCLIVGFFFHICGGWIPILIVAVLPNLNEQHERDKHQERENRRLREQLRQERMKLESFRQHTTTRLDMHDEHLGIDTHQVNPSLTNNGNAPTGYLEHIDGMQSSNKPTWYYEHDQQTKGPITKEELIERFQSGQLDEQTLLWREDLAGWVSANKIPELASVLADDLPLSTKPDEQSVPDDQPYFDQSTDLLQPVDQSDPPIQSQSFDQPEPVIEPVIPVTSDLSPDHLPESNNDQLEGDQTEWFYAWQRQTVGPITLDNVLQRVRNGRIREDTLMWNAQMDKWTPAQQIAEIAPHL